MKKTEDQTERELALRLTGVLRRPGGRRRRESGEFAGGAGPSTHELVGLEEQGGADGCLIGRADVEEAGDVQFGIAGIWWRKVFLSLTAVGQWHVHFYEIVETRKWPALAGAGPGQHDPGGGDPSVALRLGEGAPTFGDGAEIAADSALSGGVGVGRDEGQVADQAVAGALPDDGPALANFRTLGR